MDQVILGVIVFFLGAGLGYWLKVKLSSALGEKILSLESEKKSLDEALREASHAKIAAETRLKVVEEDRVQLSDRFKAVAAEALSKSSADFLQLANQSFAKLQASASGDLQHKREQIELTLKPIEQTLQKFDQKIQEVEKERVSAYSGIHEQMQNMKQTQDQLRTETANLVKALRAPQVRGRWGEMQLRRVVEMAGMVDHCDFVEQESTDNEEGRKRPDLVVKLPGGKNIIVDSKAVISSYLEAAQAESEAVKREKLKEHARHIRERVSELSKKSYWDQFENSPEFVVLFLPGEAFFSSALETDPGLIEQSVEQKVIIATPTTLIALLKAVAYGWRQGALAQNARDISELGKELYKRVGDMSEHFADVGKKLTGAVDSYNKSVGSLETRVLVTARKFKELKATDASAEIAMVDPVDKTVRTLQSGLNS